MPRSLEQGWAELFGSKFGSGELGSLLGFVLGKF